MPQVNQTPEREAERLRIERDELAAAAKRVADSLQSFMEDSTDPGSEALGAHYEVTRLLTNLKLDGRAVTADRYLSRFSVTPAEVHRFLSRHLAEDVHLRYQQAIGDRAASEAAKDIRMTAAKLDASLGTSTETASTMRNAADGIDPLKGGGPFPSELIRFGETGGTR